MMSSDYSPSHSPFELPISIYVIRCRLGRPLELLPREGASLSTTFRGAFFTALRSVGCIRPSRGVCLDSCQSPKACPVPLLHAPRSASQKRDHASPVLLRVEEPVDVDGQAELACQMTLWGRKARGLAALILTALDAMARSGVRGRQGNVRFTPDVRLAFEGTLARWAEGWLPRGADRVLVEFLGPCDTRTPDLSTLAGNAAHDLVQWDLDDRGDSEHLGKVGCDELAEKARAQARAAFACVTEDAGLATYEDRGTRFSAANHNPFRLSGLRGYCALRGHLTPALPWLALLALRGAGEKTSFGLGAVRLWFPAQPAHGQANAGQSK